MSTSVKILSALIAFSIPLLASGAVCDKACLVNKAMSGDGESANTLAIMALKESQYFKRNHDRMVDWYRISAENGNAVGQFNYAGFLMDESTSTTDCIRALYWLKRSSGQGHRLAKESVAILSTLLANQTKSGREGCRGAL